MNSAVLADMEEERRLRRVAGEVATVLGGEFRPARYRFRRVLGFGGYGAAFLFEMRDEDEFVLPVVVKADISGRVDRLRDVYKEKENFVVGFFFSFFSCFSPVFSLLPFNLFFMGCETYPEMRNLEGLLTLC